MKTECPKCGSPNARYTASEYDITLRCLCGYNRVVQTKLKTATIFHNEVEVKLPKQGTYLWYTLVCLVTLSEATSAEIKDRLVDLGMRFSVSDVASYLTILRGKKLVEPTTVRRGVAGGSTWVPAEKAMTLLGV